jgi:hypothetical protein
MSGSEPFFLFEEMGDASARRWHERLPMLFYHLK